MGCRPDPVALAAAANVTVTGERPGDRVHALDVDEATCLLDGLGRVNACVAGDVDHVLAVDAAGLVDVLDGQLHTGFNVRAVFSERTGEVREVADLELLAVVAA